MPLENIREKKVYIELDKKREIRFDMNALAELEEIYGSFDKAMAALKNSSIKAMRALLYSGLKHEDKKLTIEQVGAMVDMASLSSVTMKITEAFQRNLPEPEELEGSPVQSNDGFIPGPAAKNV